MRIKITGILTDIQNELKIRRTKEIDRILKCNSIIEKEYINQMIEHCTEICLLNSTYKEEIESAEHNALWYMKNSPVIKKFEIQKQYLTVDLDIYDPCLDSTTLYLKTEFLVDKLETDKEYCDRILNRFAPELLNETEYIFDRIDFELNKRKLILKYDNKEYLFDVKVQDIENFKYLLENNPKERFFRELLVKDKQIFLIPNLK
jgi:hypothetical protein